MRSVTRRAHLPVTPPAGIHLSEPDRDRAGLIDRLEALGLARHIESTILPGKRGGVFRVGERLAREWAPHSDSHGLSAKLAPDPAADADELEREILLALMLSPEPFAYRNYDELACAVNVRRNIVSAGRKTVLAFDTTMAAERPSDCWTYSADKGFTLMPGKPLIEALRKATQPAVSGRLYAFSCYRASEYLVLLAIAEELERCNPTLLDRLQRQWETRAIKSAAFHETFLVEYGSMQRPLPAKHYVPGDRLWFRNPDDRSSDVDGFEGSWVFYLGNGEFTNFWKADQPYTLASKCLEIYHWRNGVRRTDAGELWMDEAIVDEHVQASLRDPDEVQAILERMMRLRDPTGVYGAGGCIDTSREYPRSIWPGTGEFRLPDA